MKYEKFCLKASTVLTVTLIAACTQHEQSPAQTDGAASPVAQAPSPAMVDETTVTLDAKVEIPSGWKKEAIAPGECMTPIDTINGVPATANPYPAGQLVKFVGWNVTSSKTDATPTTVYGVLKPYDQNLSGVIFAGKRLPRPDVAGENKQYAMAGYEVAGNLPSAPGKYRFYVWTGTADSVVECDSKIVINVK